MIKKYCLTTALFAAMCMVFTTSAVAEGLALDGSLTVVSQTVDKSGGAADSQLTSRVDINAEMPAGTIGHAAGRLFAHIRAGNEAAASNDAFASSNAAAFDFSSPVLMEAWYQLDIPAGAEGHRLELALGKMDAFNLLDGHALSADESDGFLNLAFVHNPLLDAGGDIEPGTHGTSPGVRLAYVSPVKNGRMTVSAGVFATGGNGEQFGEVFNNAVSIAQVEYADKTEAGLGRSYRLYGWDNRNLQRHGWGLSLGQAVNSHVSVFARYGDRTQGSGNFNSAWTLGTQVTGVHWGREYDRLGMAYGRLNAVSGGSERTSELFYAVQINGHLHITPSVQWIDNASGTHGDDRTVYSVRAKAYF